MVEFLKANWFEIAVTLYVVAGLVAPLVAKVSPSAGEALGAFGLHLSRLLEVAKPGWKPPALPKADDK